MLLLLNAAAAAGDNYLRILFVETAASDDHPPRPNPAKCPSPDCPQFHIEIFPLDEIIIYS
jgi:hypothetical protein